MVHWFMPLLLLMATTVFASALDMQLGLQQVQDKQQHVSMQQSSTPDLSCHQHALCVTGGSLRL